MPARSATVPVWAQPTTSVTPLGPIGAYAEFISPTGNAVHIGLPGSNWSAANALNDLGQAVGQSSQPGGIAHAFLYTNGQTFDLNSLIPSQPAWTIVNSLNIDDDGRILAYGMTASSEQHTLLLIPEAVPEPSTLATGILFIFASGLVVARSKRAKTPTGKIAATSGSAGAAASTSG